MEPLELDALVAANVRAARARLNLRQEDVADRTGWARATVSAIEIGNRRVTLTDAAALCAALEIGLTDLLHGAPAEILRAFKLPG